MRSLALAFGAMLALAGPAVAASQDPMDELSGDQNSPQRHLIPPNAHEPFIEESDGTILVGYVVDMEKAQIADFLIAELKKDGWRVGSDMDMGASIIYVLDGPKPGGGTITLNLEKGRIRVLVSLG